jgi:hypothetical protein
MALRALGLKLMRAAVYADALEVAAALPPPPVVGSLAAVGPTP